MRHLAGGENARCVLASIAFGLVRSSATSSAENVPLAAGEKAGRPLAHGLNFQPVDDEAAAMEL